MDLIKSGDTAQLVVPNLDEKLKAGWFDVIMEFGMEWVESGLDLPAGMEQYKRFVKIPVNYKGERFDIATPDVLSACAIAQQWLVSRGWRGKVQVKSVEWAANNGDPVRLLDESVALEDREQVLELQ